MSGSFAYPDLSSYFHRCGFLKIRVDIKALTPVHLLSLSIAFVSKPNGQYYQKTCVYRISENNRLHRSFYKNRAKILKLCLSQNAFLFRCDKQVYRKSVFYQELAQALRRTSNAVPLCHGNVRRGSYGTWGHISQSYNNPAFYKFCF